MLTFDAFATALEKNAPVLEVFQTLLKSTAGEHVADIRGPEKQRDFVNFFLRQFVADFPPEAEKERPGIREVSRQYHLRHFMAS